MTTKAYVYDINNLYVLEVVEGDLAQIYEYADGLEEYEALTFSPAFGCEGGLVLTGDEKHINLL